MVTFTNQTTLDEAPPQAITAWMPLRVGETGTTEWVRFQDTDILVQIDGAATSVTGTVQRTTRDPMSGAAITSAPVSPLIGIGPNGSAAAGVSPSLYTEVGVAWWRVNITAVVGGSVVVSITGQS